MAQNKWLRLFETFIADIRINSKEIVSADPRGVPLILWESQRRYVHEVGAGLDNDIHVFHILKSRQLGITTVSLAIDVFWLAMHDGISGAMVTDNEGNKIKNRSEITRYINSFPDGYFGEGRFAIKTSNRDMMEFSNGATLRFLVAGTKKKSIAWAEGTGYALIHFTEMAKYADADGTRSLIEGFAQKNPHRLMLNESTAMGYNHFKSIYDQGKLDRFNQRSFFIGWWASATNRIEQSHPDFITFGRAPPFKEEREKIVQVKQLYGWTISKEQLAWIRWREANAGRDQELLQQNQPWTESDAFVMSGRSFFEVRTINKNIKAIVESYAADVPFYDDGRSEFAYKGYRYIADGDFFFFSMERLTRPEDRDLVELKVWEEPKENVKYVIGFDCAYGRNDHKDGNVFTVWRCYADRIVQVAEYATYGVDIRHASWAFFHLCAAYGDVMGNIEIGGPGRLVMQEFQHLRELLAAEHNQAKVKERKWDDAAYQVRWYLYHKPDSMGAGYVANFETNWSTKPRLMRNVASCYSCNEIVVRSRKLLEEMMLVQVDEDGGIGAPESTDTDEKDDRVFSMAFACLAWTDWVRSDMLSKGLTYETVQKLESGEVKPTALNINNIVYRWLARQNELADEEPPRGTPWQIQNGLV
jgi:hypothetical protein